MEPLSASEQNRILQVHHFLPGRSVRLIGDKYTRKEGWTSSTNNHLFKQEGTIRKVHEDIVNAIQVQLEGDLRYWHYKDLELIPVENKFIGNFDPEMIVV